MARQGGGARAAAGKADAEQQRSRK